MLLSKQNLVSKTFMFKTKNNAEETSDKRLEVSIESNKTEPAKVFNRIETFSTNYTYTKFPELINSTPASDEECFEMEEFITHYNDLWIKLVNNKDLSIVQYVRGNSGPRKDIDKYYNDNNITENLDLFEVHDVRKFGNYYYIWTHEKITKYSLYKTEYKEHHWIYKVAEDSDGHYVETYIPDPYYK